MNIYKISQSENSGWDTYDSAIVVAENEEQAKRVYPSEFREWSDDHKSWMFIFRDGTRRQGESSDWANKLANIEVKLLGQAKEGLAAGEVLCASFNAG